MSSVNYSLKHKGVRLISSEEAWMQGKNGKFKLNSKYHFLGKIDTRIPNLIITASDKKKPKFKGDVSDLNNTAKGQIVDYFFNNDGTRNKKRTAFFVIPKK